jgi:DNA-binding LacI/PurR family transcriptional regulator
VHASLDATRYLIGLGHRRIAIITGPKTTRSASDRVRGYRRALRLQQMPADADLIHYEDFDIASGYHATSRLIAMPERPTAVFCTNNTLTLGALEAIRDMGLSCPEDISLLGFDDAYWASLVRPRLTMVRQPAREIGATAARVLIGHIERKERISGEQYLPTELVIRESCVPRR